MGSPRQASLTCPVPRELKFLLSLPAKLAPAKAPYLPTCSNWDFTFKEISTSSAKNQTINNAGNRKGSNENVGNQFSVFLLPSYLQSYWSSWARLRTHQKPLQPPSVSRPKWQDPQHLESWSLHTRQLQRRMAEFSVYGQLSSCLVTFFPLLGICSEMIY